MRSPTVSRATFLAGTTALVAFDRVSRPAGAADLIPLRVGVAPTDATGEVFYGHDLGFYSAAGLDVQITQMRNTGALAAAMASGALDITTGSIVPIAEATSRGLDLRVFAPGNIYAGSPTDASVVVAADSKIATAAELNGKTFAVNGLRDLTHLSVLSWVDANGGDWKSVKVLEIPFPEVGAALASGRVDAGLSVEPFTSSLRGKVKTIGDAFSGMGKRFIVTGWFGTNAWLSQNREAARRFADTTLKVAVYANSHHDETAAVLSKYTSMPVESIRSMGRSQYDPVALTAAVVRPVLESVAKYFGVKTVTVDDLLWKA